jgi:integrase
MSVRKRTWTSGGKQKSAWAATVTDQSGKRRQKSFKTQKAAKDWAVQTEQQKKLGIYTPESETITVKEGGDLWLEKAEQDGLAPWTIYHYRRHVKNQINPRLGDMRLTELTVPVIERCCDEWRKGGKDATARKALICLKLILKEAMRRGLVPQNVARDVQIKGKKKRKLMIGREVPTAEEINILMDDEVDIRMGPAEGPFISTLVFTGMRGASCGRCTGPTSTSSTRITRWSRFGAAPTSRARQETQKPAQASARSRWCRRSSISCWIGVRDARRKAGS